MSGSNLPLRKGNIRVLLSCLHTTYIPEDKNGLYYCDVCREHKNGVPTSSYTIQSFKIVCADCRYRRHEYDLKTLTMEGGRHSRMKGHNVQIINGETGETVESFTIENLPGL